MCQLAASSRQRMDVALEVLGVGHESTPFPRGLCLPYPLSDRISTVKDSL